MIIALELPWPPTVNHYWLRNGNRSFLGKPAIEFRKGVAEAVAESGEKIEGRLSVFITLSGPNKRPFDIDNRVKAVLDALQHAGVFDDDEQIDMLIVKRLPVIKGGRCRVVVTHAIEEPFQLSSDS